MIIDTCEIIVNNPRLPNSPAEIMDEFETLICNLEAQEMEYQIVGDLNCDLLEMRKKAHSKCLIDISDIYQLKQLKQQSLQMRLNQFD